jgi:hypothetical protein
MIDPSGGRIEDYRKVRDAIRQKVEGLLKTSASESD